MLIPIRVALAALSAATVFLTAPVSARAEAADVAAELDRLLASETRTPKNAVRDKYRHPKEVLLFFGIAPDMHVVEVWPSAGWWTEILAPLLREQGKYTAAWYATPSKNTQPRSKTTPRRRAR